MAGPAASRITIPDIDLDRDGKQVGWARLPHSSDRSAYGWLPIPVAVIRNGPGPTVMITAGIHGDEHEGQVVALRLIREIEPSKLRGRLIILPAVNAPAAAAGTRVSPIDGVNLNRAFPGDPHGSVTAILAHWFETVLMPCAQVVLDLHSGGKSLVYRPAILAQRSGVAALDSEALQLMGVFGAPVGYVMTTPVDDRTSLGAAVRQSAVMLCTELGGGGGLDQQGLAVGMRGVRQVLDELGVLPDDADRGAPTPLIVEVDAESYAYAPFRGLFEYRVEVGSTLAAGEPIGRLHFLDDPLRPPVPVEAPIAGLLLCRRHPGPCDHGDCLAQIGRPSA